MMWVILATVVGLLLGAVLSRAVLKAAASKPRWAMLQPSDSIGGGVSGLVVVLGIAALFFGFGAQAAGAAAIAGAIGGVAWPALRRSETSPKWLLAAQGAGIGVAAVPLLLGAGVAIASLGGPLSGNPDVWRDLVGDRAFPAWVATVRSGNPDYRRQAMALIRRLGPRATPVMLAALQNDAAPVRLEAVEGLARVRPPDASTKIIPLLSDPDASVRKAAASALEKMEDARAVMPLLEAAGETKDPSESSTLARAARNLPGGAETARDCVLGGGGCGENEAARFGAIQAVGAFGNVASEDAKPMLRALRDPSPRIRKSALQATRHLFDVWARSNGQVFISLTAMDSLIEHQTSFPDVDPNEIIAAAAALMQDEDREVRVEAGIWVPSMCEGNASFNNVDGPRLRDPDSRMGGLDTRRLTPVFLRMLKNPDRSVAGGAARALAYLGERRAIPVLLERDAAENLTYNCLYCAALETLGVGPLAHYTNYPGMPK